ncbi:MAG: hypothetical protein COS88_01075 [Chloroflexi bacterium CG07_land_8_20_14_0_80_51_10]|nr:MAG: hypothetical protein COS88_01075 [Chloroflexi bacterium CG07_land_8_20_14_0_80_51_10]
MRCKKARERLQEYIEGALKGGDLRALEEHLQSCQDCRREQESLSELEALLRQEVPKYWESIEPSPDFLARLKRMKLKPPPRQAPSIAEALSALWGKHRLVLAAGLSICIVVALVLTIPRVTSPVEEAPIVAVKEVVKEVPVEKTVEREVVKERPAKKGAAEPTESEAMLARAMVPEAAPALSTKGMPESTTMDRALTIIDYTAEQVTLAIEIALESSEVQEAINNQKSQVVKVLKFDWGGDFICTGPTVTIALEEAEPPGTLLYVCVDLDKSEVVKVMRLPERGPVLPSKTPPPPPSQ